MSTIGRYIITLSILWSLPAQTKAGPTLSQPTEFRTRSVYALLAEHETSDGGMYDSLLAALSETNRLSVDMVSLDVLSHKGAHGDWKLLRFHDVWKSNWQYLFFRSKNKETWRYEGQVSFTGQYYRQPSHRFESANGIAWIAFDHIRCYGTGVLSRESSWYSFGKEAGSCGLSYLLDGHFVDSDDNRMCVSYRTLDVQLSQTDAVCEVIVTYELTMARLGSDASAGKTVLREAEVVVSYSWSDKEEVFKATTNTLEAILDQWAQWKGGRLVIEHKPTNKK